MSGRIYDSGVPYGSGLSDLPTCDKCGADMWKSAETNFYGTICIIKNCNGKPLYGKEFMIGGEIVKPTLFTSFGEEKRIK